MDIQNTLAYLSLITQIGTMLTLVYALGKFLNRPNQTQNERLASAERRLESVERRIDEHERHIRAMDDGTRVIQEALLALMDHAINGNDIERLRGVRDKLEQHLIEK